MSQVAMIILVLFLPISGGILSFWLRDKQRWIATLSLGTSLFVSLYLLVDFSSPIVWRWEWMSQFELGLLYDKAAGVLISLVLFVSLLVHIFSGTYMQGDDRVNDYFLKLHFFVFSMLGLLLADHLILFFIFWEMVGVASYLLIGFWYRKEGVPDSARTAFMVNRVADAALLAGLLILYRDSDNLILSEITAEILLIPSVLIAVGAFGKSAQFPFSGWLIQAMAGPTPVSALIHAATMVAAGVYLLYRTAPIMHPDALMMITIIGMLTAMYGAFSALVQFDIKKVLAYSTISQLGYMMIGIGVEARDASLFHLFTHAFFKAGLFLGAASIINYFHHQSSKDPQDMRLMGGLKAKLPWTYRSFLVCSLALAGVPFFAGFMSKDAIILAAMDWASTHASWTYAIPDAALLVALLTTLYVGRMVLLMFFGNPRVMDTDNLTKEPRAMTFPLIMLAIGSLWIIHSFNPLSHESWLLAYVGNAGVASLGLSGIIIPLLSSLMVLIGLGLSYYLFRPSGRYAQLFHHMVPSDSIMGKMFMNGFYLNELYKAFGNRLYQIGRIIHGLDQQWIDKSLHAVAIGSVVLSKVLSIVDRFVIDGPVNLSASFSAFIGRRLAGLSARDMQAQLLWLLFFVILILSFIVVF